MRIVYKCEKCGKTYDNEKECENCEKLCCEKAIVEKQVIDVVAAWNKLSNNKIKTDSVGFPQNVYVDMCCFDANVTRCR